MRTPLSTILHLGSARSGTEHFWRQRLTGAASVPLAIFFVVLMAATIGRSHAEVVAILGSPLVAVMLLLLVVSVAVHMRIGMQVVIEDYVHAEGLKVVAFVASTFFTVAVAAVAIVAVLKLALGA